MHPIQIAFFGLFLFLLEMCILVFADVVIILGVVSIFATGDPLFSIKMFAWGVLSIMIGLALGFVGKLLCFAVPEEGARKLIILSVVCDLCAAGLRYGWVTGALVGGLMSALVIPIVIYLLTLGSYALFLNFLARMGDNVGEARVGRYISLIYGLFGGGFVLLFVLFFSPNLFLLLLGLEMLVSLLLYTYTIYTLFRAMPMYIDEVKAGHTDPTESGIDRRWRERKEKRSGRAAGGATKAKPAEKPKGTPPPGANLYRVPKGIPDLHLAVKEGDAFKVETRLAHGDSVTETVRHGLTPLHIAAGGGVMEVAQALIKAGAQINETCEEGLTPLFMSIQTGKPNITGYFLDRGADLHHRTEHGYTPLHWACCAPHPNLTGTTRVKMVELLLEAGSDPNATTNDGQTPLDLAKSNELNELTNFINVYLGNAPPPQAGPESQAAPKPQSPMLTDPCPGSHLCIIPDELTPLHIAAKEGDPHKVQIQLASGVSIDERVANDLSALHIAAITGVMGVADLLLKQGAQVDSTCDEGITPIFLAIAVNNPNMMGFLLSRGANVNHQTAHGQTPLHWACGVAHPKLDGQNRKRVVEMLLNSGASKDVADKSGQTPYMLASAKGHEEVLSLLGSVQISEPMGGSVDEDEYYD